MNNRLSCISHEIRNQVSVCELYTQIIKKTLEKNRFENKSVDNAINCICKSLKLISNNLTDLKSLDNLILKRCNIKDILKESINLSMIYAQEKDIEITLNCDISCDIYIDENKFLGCLINIIKNAIEAIDKKGFIKIEVTEEKKLASIKIINNGKMIKNKSEIFNEGFTTKKTGNGFGLAICKENMIQQNGKLELIKSDENTTEFEIVVPKI